MAIMQTTIAPTSVAAPALAESFKAMDIEHTGKITLDEFQTFAHHMHKKRPEKGEAAEGKTPAKQAEAMSRPSSRASSAFDEALEESLRRGGSGRRGGAGRGRARSGNRSKQQTQDGRSDPRGATRFGHEESAGAHEQRPDWPAKSSSEDKESCEVRPGRHRRREETVR